MKTATEIFNKSEVSVNHGRWANYFLSILGISLLIVSFNNCGNSFKVISSDQSVADLPTKKTDDWGSVSPPELSSKASGIFDSNCMANNNYDACLIWKNPVAAQNKVFAKKLQRSDSLGASQNFGVKLSHRLNLDRLKSPTIDVTASAGTTPPFQNGQLRIAYENDFDRSWLAQTMAYFWITLQETEMLRRTGIYFAAGKNIPVDAFATNVSLGPIAGNAFYSPSENKVVMGYAIDNENGAGKIAHEMALNAEVYLHEMGHASLEWALHGADLDIYRDLNSQYLVRSVDGKHHIRNLDEKVNGDVNVFIFCKTVDGCMWALNEGQADFHHLMIFHDSLNMGETINNSLSGGLDSGAVPRNVDTIKSWTTAEIFAKSAQTFNNGNLTVSGEIHGMGSAYASILWAIYTHPQMKRSHFEKVFMEHLKLMAPSSRFQESRDGLISIAESMADSDFSGVHYGKLIRSVFDQKGVAP